MRLFAIIASFFMVLGVLAACRNEPAPQPTSQMTEPTRPLACPMHYLPVCASKDGVEKDFPNQCMAEGNGYKMVKQGLCK